MVSLYKRRCCGDFSGKGDRQEISVLPVRNGADAPAGLRREGIFLPEPGIVYNEKRITDRTVFQKRRME